MDIIFLRILIFIIFCLIGLGIGGLVGNFKKVDLPKKSFTEECSEKICPIPEDYKGDKK
jgi:hypothetical protein